MAIYAVVFNDHDSSDDDVRPERFFDKVEAAYPRNKSYMHGKRFYFIETSDVTSEVKRKLDIAENGNSGVDHRMDMLNDQLNDKIDTLDDRVQTIDDRLWDAQPPRLWSSQPAHG